MQHIKNNKKVIEEISKELSITCMMVSHDAADSLSWADRIIVMKEGLIIQDATPTTIYHTPADEYCAGLFGEYNKANAAIAKVLFPEVTIHADKKY